MQIEVNKNELAGALNALGKLVCRTSPVEAYRSVQIVGKENKLHFRTAGPDESIEFSMDATVERDFSVIVGFELFRQAVRGCKNKVLLFELADDGHLAIDGMQMTLADCEFPVALEVPDGAKSEPLPDSCVELLNTAAAVVNRNEYRKVLQGINLGKDGITATNGKELFNAPIQIDVESLTVPFPLALITSKASGASRLNYWTDGVKVFFQIMVGSWSWSGKAIAGIYPNWKQVMPQPNMLTRSITFPPESVQQLEIFLKNVPDDPTHNAIELSDGSGMTLNVRASGMMKDITAEFTGDWSESLVLSKTILLRLLHEGHWKIQCGDGHAPILATGGIGQYVAMPMYQPKAEPKEDPKTGTVAAEPQTEPETTESNHNKKECKLMVDINNPVVSAPVQTVVPKTEPETNLNPLDELSVSIEAFKQKLKASFDEVTALARKVKEVQIAQKQTERDFIQAKRAIERIRMVSGF